MRLADTLQAMDSDAFPEFTKRVATSQHFELLPDVVTMAVGVAMSDARRRLAAYEFCRLPYKTVWLEWVASDQGIFGFTKEQPVKRMGVLFEAADDTHACGRMTFSSLHAGDSVHVLPIGAHFDFRSEPDAKLISDALRAKLATMPEFQKSDRHELLEMANRVALDFNQYNRKYIKQYNAWPEELQKEAVSFFCRLLRGRVQFALAAVATMNSKNLVAVTAPEDLTKLNRSRAKKKKAPLFAFRSVRISLSKSQTRRARNEGNGSMPLHIVRGHFKVRKSGIYWWSPFWRGDAAAGVVARKGYEVAA